MAVGIDKHPAILSKIAPALQSGELFPPSPVESQSPNGPARPKQAKLRDGGDMDIEERMAKTETEIALLKEMQRMLLQEMTDLRHTMERGFAEQRGAMERGFAEERAARERMGRWTFSALLTILALVLGIIARLTGLL